MSYLIQDSQTRRFLLVKYTLVLSASRATRWHTLDQAIDYILINDLPDNYVVVNFDTMRLEFSRQLPAKLWP